MKKLLIIIPLLLLPVILIWAEPDDSKKLPNKRITVYVKDSLPEIFYTSDLYSTGFTTTDDGTTYNVFGLSIDSMCSFPIERIDSVVFGNNDIIDVKGNAFELTEDLLKYIEDYDGERIRFNSSAVKTMLPKENTNVYYLGVNELFPAGLCAKITKIVSGDNCTEIYLEDLEPSQIFNQLILTSDLTSTPSEMEIDSSEDMEMDGDEDEDVDESGLTMSRATVWDGQHSYKFKGKVGVSSSHTTFDALKGDLISKITICVDGDFYFKSDNETKKNITYFSGNTVHVPISGVEYYKKWFSPKLDMKVKYKIKSESGNVDLKMKRKFDASFYVIILDEDTVIYRPEIVSTGEPEIAIGEKSFIDGSASLLVSFNLYIRPYLHNKGLLATVTAGPSLSGKTGLAQLGKMEKEYVDSLYEKATLKLNTALSVVGSRTEYKKNDIVSTSKLKKRGKPLKGTLSDGNFFLFPQFSRIDKTIGDKTISISFASSTKTYSNMRIGAGIYNNSKEETPILEYVIGDFKANSSSKQEFDTNIEFDKKVDDSTKVRPLIEFGDYWIKGPEGVNPECALDGKDHPHAIDLGLPSGLKWACCHVGANKPEEYGGAFQKFSDFKNDTWDDSWRLPTYKETTELVKNCSWELATRNGVRGFIGTGPNGKTIFMPASGFIADNGVTRYDVGTCMYMWTTTKSIEGGVHVRFLDPNDFDEFEYDGTYDEVIVPGLWIVPDHDPQTDYASFRLVKK